MHARLRRPAAALITTTLAASVLGIAPAAHAADGTVSGTVTGSGAALADVDVELFEYNDVDDYWESIEYTSTDDEGDYSFVVPAGAYRIGFSDYQNGFVSEYYEDAARVSDADTVTVASAGDIVADADLAPGAHITGEVTGPGESALSGIYVQAYEPVEEDDGYVYYSWVGSAWTDLDGSYDIRGLAAGSYLVQFSDGIMDEESTYATEWYDDATIPAQAEEVSVEAEGTTPGIDAELAPDAELSGRVTDSTGAGLEGTWIDALVKVGDEWEYTESAYTGADGTYVLDGLRAGTYRVEFNGRVGDDWASEYWDDAAYIEDADDVVLAAGAERPDVDATLVPGEHDPEMLPYFESTSAPVVSGTAQVGSTLSATAGGWSPTPSTVEYFWYRDGEWIDGAFSATYVPTAADLGKQLTVQTVANGDGYERSYSDVSAPTAPVAAAAVVVPPAPVVTPPAPVVTPVPVVTAPVALAAILEGVDVKGKAKVGKTLKLTGLDKLFRASTPVTYSFTWFAGKKAIKKATKSKLKVTRAMKGKKLSVKVTAKAASTKKSVKLKVGKVR